MLYVFMLEHKLRYVVIHQMQKIVQCLTTNFQTLRRESKIRGIAEVFSLTARCLELRSN